MTGLILRGLMRLPPRLLVRLSGRPPVVHDGVTLHPEMQFLLMLAARSDRAHASVADHRAAFRRSQRAIDGWKSRVASVADLTIDGGLKARHYAPGGSARPLLVFYHGGGFAVGDIDTHDGPCRFLCRELDAHVLSVDYRLAPEHPFPAAVEDADAAFAWAADRAADLGADPARVGVGGDSAGGNLAAVVCVLRAKHPVRPAAQLLLYPAIDRTRPYPSLAAFADGYILTAGNIAKYTDHYAGGRDLTDVRLCPIRGDLAGLPPAVVVTAAFDPLRDEGDAYADALAAAGTPVQKLSFPLVHGFANLIGFSPACRRALAEAAHAFRHTWEAGR